MVRPLNFKQIQAFKAVMQMGTATRAALMLNTTQPSISRRIAELQDATELRLFQLHHGRLRPTSEGKLLYQTIQRHFDGLEKIESVVSIMRKSGTGVLRLGCTPTLGMGLLPNAVRQFMLEFPNTYLNVQTLSTQQLADYLHQNLFDLVFTTGTLDHSDFQPVVIRRSAAVCVLPLGHRLKDKKFVDLNGLKGERILSLNNNDEITIKIKSLLQASQVPDDFLIETTSSVTICALVAAGNGVAIVNPYVAQTFSNQLHIKPFKPTVAVPIQMAMPSQTAPSVLARAFIDIMMKPATAPA